MNLEIIAIILSKFNKLIWEKSFLIRYYDYMIYKGGKNLVNQAIKICCEHNEVSTHLFQRKLAIGYTTALKLYKKLKELGILVKEKYNTSFFGRSKSAIINKDKAERALFN